MCADDVIIDVGVTELINYKLNNARYIIHDAHTADSNGESGG